MDNSEDWVSCTLCRAGRQGVDILHRAQTRKVKWPEHPQYSHAPFQDAMEHTTIDKAFEGILQYMSTSSRQCRRYYASSQPSTHSLPDRHHCNRFHTPEYTQPHRRHPLQRSEDMKIMVEPGTYAVTAGAWGKNAQQTHVVRVGQGQSVNLDFVL